MGRFARSWDLFKTSLHVVRQDKELLWMPVLSALASLLAVAAIAGVGFAAAGWPNTRLADGSANVPGIVLAFLLYLALAFIGQFFAAAVIAGATERLKGGDPTLGSSLRAAAGKAGKILLWSLLVATVNVLLQAARERSGAVGKFAASIAGMAWNLATTFVVPVLLFEQVGVGGSVQRSAGLLRKTWGETLIGQGGLGLAGMVFTLGLLAVGFVLFMLLAPLGAPGLVAAVAVLVLGVVLVSALFSVLGGVYKAALYQYATTGGVGGGFTPQQLGGAFVPK